MAAVPVASPEVEARRLRAVISGEVPSALRPPPGCGFYTRCPRAMAVCGNADTAAMEFAAFFKLLIAAGKSAEKFIFLSRDFDKSGLESARSRHTRFLPMVNTAHIGNAIYETEEAAPSTRMMQQLAAL